MKKVLFFILTVFFTLISVSLYADENSDDKNMPDPYSPSMIKAFADDLYQNGFWDEAESEYKRYLFTYDNTENPDYVPDSTVVFKLASMYHTTQDTDGAVWLSKTFSDQVPIEISEKLFINSAGMAFKKRDINLFNSLINPLVPDFSKDIQLLVPISIALLDKDVPLVTTLLTQASEEYQIFLPSATLAQNYKTKNPGLAMCLSIILPGSGKWYTGSFSSFLTSFCTIGAFTAGTIWTGIESEWKDFRPYVFGTCALVFYIADIYGAYKSAQRYNEYQYRMLEESVDLIYEELF